MGNDSEGRLTLLARDEAGRPRAARRRLLTFVIPAKSLPRSRYGAGIHAALHWLRSLLFDPIGSHRADTTPSGPRAGVPVRGAWESACGWEARWNVWLASPSSPIWRGDGEQSHRSGS